MPFPQQFIELINLSAGQLYVIGGQAGIEFPKTAKKWELAWELASLPEARIEELAGNWLDAGQPLPRGLSSGTGRLST